MSKILKSFGMAALLVALLAGTGMAATDAAAVDGTVTATFTLGNIADTTFDPFTPGSTATEDVSDVSVQTNNGWKLTVEDVSGGLADEPGYMELYAAGAYVTGADTSLDAMFGVLVSGIGDNGVSGGTFDAVTDATDLTDGNAHNLIVEATPTGSTPASVDLRFSQAVSYDDPAGTYRIDLEFALISNA